MQDDYDSPSQSPLNPQRGQGRTNSSKQGFFSPVSSLALDFNQFVMEAKAVEQTAFAPAQTSFELHSKPRVDIIEAEKALSATSFEQAQTLALQISGGANSAQLNFSMPLFNRNPAVADDKTVSELKSFAHGYESITSGAPLTSSQQLKPILSVPPVQIQNSKKPATRGELIISGLFSKLKSVMAKKTSVQKIPVQKSSAQNIPVQKSPSKNIVTGQNMYKQTQTQNEISSPVFKSNTSPNQATQSEVFAQARKIGSLLISPPTLQKIISNEKSISNKTEPEQKFVSNKTEPEQKLISNKDVSEQKFAPDKYESQKVSISPPVLGISRRIPTIPDFSGKASSPKAFSSSPDSDSERFQSRPGPLKLKTQENSTLESDKPVSGGQVSYEQSAGNFSNPAFEGFESPLITPRRKNAPSQYAQSAKTPLSKSSPYIPVQKERGEIENPESKTEEPESKTQAPESKLPLSNQLEVFRRPSISSPSSRSKPPESESSSDTQVMRSIIPNYSDSSYGASMSEPTKSVQTNYSSNSRTENIPETSVQNSIQTPAVSAVVSDPKRQIPIQRTEQTPKRTSKPITIVRAPPQIPPKKAMRTQTRGPSAIEELESAAENFASFSKKKSQSKKEISVQKVNVEKINSKSKEKQTKSESKVRQIESEPDKKEQIQLSGVEVPVVSRASSSSASSSLAKRLGMLKSRTMPMAQISKPIGTVEESDSNSQEVNSSLSQKPKPQSDSIQNKIPKNSGETASSISSSEKELLTPSQPINEQKQQAANQMADELLFAYAKENYKWLYEIYKMGGLSLEEFRSRIKEKMQMREQPGEGSSQKSSVAPENAAFSNLSRMSDKKFKK